MTSKSVEVRNVDPLDRIAGFWTAFLLNLVLIVLALGLMMDGEELAGTPMIWLPWVFNVLILAVALWKYIEFAVGYLFALGVITIAAAIYWPSCVATCIVASAIGLEPVTVSSGGTTAALFWPAFFVLYVIFWTIIGLFFSVRHYRKAVNNKTGPDVPSKG